MMGCGKTGQFKARIKTKQFKTLKSGDFMKVATVQLKSMASYSQGRYHDTEKLNKESHADYEERTWRNKLHVNKDGFVFIPAMAFKNCISECAKYLSIQIPGKGKATYTKHFDAGVIVSDALVLDTKAEDVECERLFIPNPGTTSRVKKSFPIIHEWSGEVKFFILDETITEKVFTDHLKQAGQFIGIGRWRPRNRGLYGRFTVESVDFAPYEI